MFGSVRIRLTLWYAGVLALSLVAFALVIYYAAAASFHERQDESLRSTAQTVASAYVEELGEAHSPVKAGEVVLAELTFPNRYVQLADSNGQRTQSRCRAAVSRSQPRLRRSRRTAERNRRRTAGAAARSVFRRAAGPA